MAENESKDAASKQVGLRPKAKGNVFLKIGIVLMTGVLIYSILQPKYERENEVKLLRLSRAKVKMLFNLEYRYIFNDTTFVDDMDKLIAFGKTVTPDILPDSLFRPVQSAYARFEDYRPMVEGMSLSEFRQKFMDSLATNPMTGERFILELTTKAGRKSFNIKPSTNDDDMRYIGGVKEGEISWDEKAELAL